VTTAVVATTCSKCDGKLDSTGFPHWCKACRAKYKRDYEALRGEMSETRGYAAGVSAMREFLAVNFEGYSPTTLFSGPQIGHIIRHCAEPAAP
jgi:hypothetical protein